MPAGTQPIESRFAAAPGKGEVSALLLRPQAARCLLVLAHGAGAGMRHRFMAAISEHWPPAGSRPCATSFLTWRRARAGRTRARFCSRPSAPPSIAARRRRRPICPARRRQVDGRAHDLARRRRSAARRRARPRLLRFSAPPRGPARDRARRASGRGRRADAVPPGRARPAGRLALLRPICAGLGDHAMLHVVPTADHSFRVLKSAGRSDLEVLAELAATTAAFAARLS